MEIVNHRRKMLHVKEANANGNDKRILICKLI